jgi:hypothetical protein
MIIDNIQKNGADNELVFLGGDTGALRDKTDIERMAYSDTYYESIRNRKSKSDILAIAKNTGFSNEEINAIREHIFIKEHNLGDGIVERFASDYEQAQAWQRMERGWNIHGDEKYKDVDILLLNHELEELTIMAKYEYDYPMAHTIAHEKYPWSMKIMEVE